MKKKKLLFLLNLKIIENIIIDYLEEKRERNRKPGNVMNKV